MTTRHGTRSADIVAIATEIIEITWQIDASIDPATTLEQDRSELAATLMTLTTTGTATRRVDDVDKFRAIADSALVVLLRRRGQGMTRRELAKATGERMGKSLSERDVDQAISLLATASDVRSKGDRLLAGTGMPRHVSGDGPSIDAMILDALRHAPCPIGVAAIRERIAVKFGTEIARTTISPILTRMDRAGGLVVHIGDRWTAM